MADVRLPPTLPSLYADLPRRLEVDAATVNDVIDRLDERWPGLTTGSASPGRRSARTSTSTSTASGPGSTPPSSPARGST